ncbi:hypothetical protein ACQEVY_05100 [Streptomyces sp. CA-288835]|uniref:hypothetical protein n=1 Tax=Streptomyces sp. CA-288835 TaxID=3240069 RepID=UPI003D8DB5A2
MSVRTARWAAWPGMGLPSRRGPARGARHAFFYGNDPAVQGRGGWAARAGDRGPWGHRLAGYDNWDTMALASRPPLTTVDVNLA